MDIFDYFKEKMAVTGQEAIQKAKDASEITRLNSLMNNLQKNIDNTCDEIGRLIMKQYEGLDAKVIEEKLTDMKEGTSQKKIWKKILSIKEMEAQLAAYEEQVKEIKKVICCPKCGNEVPQNARFCGKCGALLEISVEEQMQDGKICPECGSVLPKDAKFCHNCGSELEENTEVRICSSCGHQMSGDAAYCEECGAKMQGE